MNIKRYLNTVILLLMTGFTVFSIYGAFIGAPRAQVFFNSVPMVIFWCLLLLILVIGFFVYTSLSKHLPLMAIHAGCILVLAGGMVGSEKAHKVSDFATEISKRLISRLLPSQQNNDSEQSSQYRSFTKGSISLHQGQSSNQVTLETGTGVVELPFTVRLKEAFIEYYDKPAIRFYFRDGIHFDIPAEIDEGIEFPDGRGAVQVVGAYRNFKMKQVDGRMTPYESTEPGSNPAYELTFTPAGKPLETFFVFERFPMHAMSGRSYHAEYMVPRVVKDYKSTLQVVDKGELVRETTIEVNKPLYYGGYHFYQSTFAYDASGPVSGISVSSARGVWAVFVGYAMIFTGLVFQFWPKILKGRSR